MMDGVNADDFFVEDEDPDVIDAAYAAGRPVVTKRPPTSSGASSNRRPAGQFVIIETKNGKYRFNLKAANGVIIATSETYSTKAAALKAIESVKLTAPDADIDSLTG